MMNKRVAPTWRELTAYQRAVLDQAVDNYLGDNDKASLNKGVYAILTNIILRNRLKPTEITAQFVASVDGGNDRF